MLPSEEIKDKINLVDLINEYLPLKKAGVNFRALCPFHQEKTPSFMVSPTKQIWHCFGCSLGGDHFEFIKQIEGVEFPEALEILASRAGITLRRPTVEYQKEADQKKTLLAINDLAAKFYAKVLAESKIAEEARVYLETRGLKKETITKWMLGWAPDDFHIFENFIVKHGYQRGEAVAAGLLIEKDGKYFDRFRGRIMFPLLDIHGRVAGFTARALKEGEGIAKYVNSPETLVYNKSSLIYGLHFAKTEIRNAEEVVIVEGNMDVITCHEANFANVVGSSGTALTQRQLEILKRFTDNINFALDVDEAGFQALRRAVELALSLGFNVRITNIPQVLAKDPDELIRKNPERFAEQVTQAKNFLDFYFEENFAKIDLSTSIGKKKITNELFPLLVLLPDPIDRAHYLRKLAQGAGIDEKILFDLLNRRLSQREKNIPSSLTPRVREGKSKQEILERRVLGLFLKSAKSLSEELVEIEVQDFSTPALKEIWQLAFANIPLEQIDLEQFKAANPKLAGEIDLLIFAVENELSTLPELNLNDLAHQFLSDFKIEALKQRMKSLTEQIKQAERIGRLEEVRQLSTEFNNLTRELAKYHVTQSQTQG